MVEEDANQSSVAERNTGSTSVDHLSRRRSAILFALLIWPPVYALDFALRWPFSRYLSSNSGGA